MDYSTARRHLARRRYEDLAAELKKSSARLSEEERASLLSTAVKTCEACDALERRRRIHAEAALSLQREEAALHALLEGALVGMEAVGGSQDVRSDHVPERSPPPIHASPQLEELTVFGLGANEVLLEGSPITDLGGANAQGLFRMLLLKHRQPVPKDVLMELFWPDAVPDSARRNLHQAIYNLRQALGGPGAKIILFSNGAYSLNPEVSAWLDFEEFETQSLAGEQFAARGDYGLAAEMYSAAESLYGGDLFSDRPYDDWLEPERDCLRDRHRRLVEWLCDRADQRGDLLTVVALLQKLVRDDPLDELAQRRLARTYAKQGQRGLALRQLKSCQHALRRRLSIELSPETQALLENLS